VDVSVWDELIASTAMRGGLAALYIHRSTYGVICMVNKSV